MATRISSSTSAPAKPWTSGRVLTPAQRERKRYKDRISKREKQEKERESLKSLQSQVAALHLLLESYALPSPGVAPVAISPDHSVSSCLLPWSDSHSPSLEEACTTLAPRSPVSPFYSQTIVPVAPAHGSWANRQSTTWSPIFPSLQESGSCMILEFTDSLFDKYSRLNIPDICSDDQLNQDAIIRGVLEGWHFLEDRPYSCPLWKVISQVDERIFMHSGIVTRLTMLSTILKMLVATVCKNDFVGVPPWYRPRPSQRHFPHKATADYFAWPGFRERLVFTNCDILTDRFFKHFASYFRLSWPHSIGNAYETDPATALYSFSDTFTLHLVDLSRWQMCQSFFALFPTLEEDMAPESPTSSSYFTVPPDNPLSVLPI
ncbi:hypothetical protein BDV26DRAFT_266907 [Aspergillus bertholletiae]|uniref:BZIP domain-containing protein n=1 Tax=Aspergillus bertholletiae TaxID=1226010 RepID=A0A5N7B1G4_9EURO|nr:hypothetical protein BDV26DRAFT_266907 [Aspergillus bertholletiae]